MEPDNRNGQTQAGQRNATVGPADMRTQEGSDARSMRAVGRVIGTEDATPLEFWVGVQEGAYLQLDDVVVLDRVLPDGEIVRVYGVVSQVRARHDGLRFDSDVFLVADGVLPADVSEAAQVQSTRFEPEVFVPPRPGDQVLRARRALSATVHSASTRWRGGCQRACPETASPCSSTSTSSTAPRART